MNLFSEDEVLDSYFSKKVESAIAPIVKEYIERGVPVHEISAGIFAVVSGVMAEKALRQGLEVRKRKRIEYFHGKGEK